MLESLFNNVAGFKSCNFIEKRLQHRCFPVNIAKVFKNTFFWKNISGAAASVGCKNFTELQKAANKMKLNKNLKFIVYCWTDFNNMSTVFFYCWPWTDKCTVGKLRVGKQRQVRSQKMFLIFLLTLGLTFLNFLCLLENCQTGTLNCLAKLNNRIWAVLNELLILRLYQCIFHSKDGTFRGLQMTFKNWNCRY